MKSISEQIKNYLRILNEGQLSIGYHVSLKKRENSIITQGLTTRLGKVYFWKHLDMAYWFAELHASDGNEMIIWKVDLNGLPLERDPEAEDMSEWSSKFPEGTPGHAYIFIGDISPDRVSKFDEVS